MMTETDTTNSPKPWTPAHSDCSETARRESATVTAFGEWILSADADPGDVPPVYVLICKAEAEDRTPCGVESGPLGSTDAMREWARVHVWNNTGHRSFRLVADVPMVMVPKVEPL